MSGGPPDKTSPGTPRTAPGASREDAGTTPIPSASLLKGRDAITIEHNGRLYQLRKTRQGKLILTK